LGTTLLICYIQCKFYGIALGAIGVFSVPIILLGISLLGGISGDAYRFSEAARLYGHL